jgi:hypothetical protein
MIHKNLDMIGQKYVNIVALHKASDNTSCGQRMCAHFSVLDGSNKFQLNFYYKKNSKK